MAEDDGVVSEKDLACGASLKGVDSTDEVKEAARVPSVGGIQDVEDSDACIGELFAPFLGAGIIDCHCRILIFCVSNKCIALNG